MPEGTILGWNTLYFNHPKASKLQKEFVAHYFDKYKEAPHWEADRAYFALAFKAGVEAAHKKVGSRWPSTEDIVDHLPGHEIQGLGGPGRFRADRVAEQVFYQGAFNEQEQVSLPDAFNLKEVLFQPPRFRSLPATTFGTGSKPRPCRSDAGIRLNGSRPSGIINNDLPARTPLVRQQVVHPEAACGYPDGKKGQASQFVKSRITRCRVSGMKAAAMRCRTRRILLTELFSQL